MLIKKEFMKGRSSVTMLAYTRSPAGTPRKTGGRLRSMTTEKSILELATIRRNRGISLEQISESTKISVRALEAIERGDFRKLPGGIYNTSYIRQYARAIDYDETAILAFYAREMNDGAGDSRATRGKGLLGGLRPASVA